MDSYTQALKFLFDQLPCYQRQGGAVLKFDLSNIESFVNRLNNPHKKIKTIHVAGTNGKGSTSHMMASVLQEAGYKVGLYTSPHLKDFRERIKINGIMIPKRKVSSFVGKHQDFFKNNKLSFFEMTVGLAFHYFAQSHVDIAIIEVGLGGRLDATNIISPVLAVITNIGFDHTQFLGDSFSKIANEKAGIIKKGVPVLIGEYNPETALVFKRYSNGGMMAYGLANYKSDLIALYQQKNLNTAINAIKLLPDFNVSDTEIDSAILKVKEPTNFIGRWDVIGVNPKIVADVTHNIEGFKFMIDQLKKYRIEGFILFLVLLKKKMLNLL